MLLKLRSSRIAFSMIRFSVLKYLSSTTQVRIMHAIIKCLIFRMSDDINSKHHFESRKEKCIVNIKKIICFVFSLQQWSYDTTVYNRSDNEKVFMSLQMCDNLFLLFISLIYLSVCLYTFVYILLNMSKAFWS